MTESIDLSKLAEPFPLEDIEWRVSRAGIGGDGKLYCLVLAYITARAIQQRLDDVCGPENWQLERPMMLDVNGKSAFAVGISIRFPASEVRGETITVQGSQWITKWDVAEPTAERGSISAPAKGGYSGAMKRAGAQWGIGRYLYRLDETFADTSTDRQQGRNWNYAQVNTDDGKRVYYWKNPALPAWALPKEEEHEVSEKLLHELKQEWRLKFAPESRNPGELAEGFTRFVHSVVGEFPASDHKCWNLDAYDKCKIRLDETTDPSGVDGDVPFEAAKETRNA